MTKTNTSTLLSIGFFIAGALLLLPLLSGDLLYMAQSRSLFMSGSQFWHDCMRHAGGGLEWLGLALTQLGYYPWLCGWALVLIWLATWWLLRRIFPLPQQWQWLHFIPLVAMLTSVIALGYWIYYLKQPGYIFRHSLGLLSVAALLHWRHRHWGWVISLVTLCFYPLLGWYSVLALLLRLLRCLFYRQWVNGIIAALSASIGPALLSDLYPTMRTSAAWLAGFPLIQSNQYQSEFITAIHIIAIASLALIVAMAYRYRPNATIDELSQLHPNFTRFVTPACVVWMFICAFLCRPTNTNLYAEMRINRQLEEYRWTDVLAEIDHAGTEQTQQMVLAKNMALLQLGQLPELTFCFPNEGSHPSTHDSLHVHMAQTIAPLAYLYHGLTNDAIHWCMENSVEYGFSVSDLRILSLSAIISGQSQLAAKYLSMLGLTWFQQPFVRRYYPLTKHPEWINDYPELQIMKQLHNDTSERIMSDDGHPEYRIYKIFSNQLGHDSQEGTTLGVLYSMMRKAPTQFWFHLDEYCDRQSQVPGSFQEAALLFATVSVLPSDRPNFTVDNEVTRDFFLFQQAYNNLCTQQLTTQQIGEQLKPQFGNTYWWYYHFCNNPKIY